jgi:hypothetical protein
MKIQFRKANALLLWKWVLEHVPAAMPVRNFAFLSELLALTK